MNRWIINKFGQKKIKCDAIKNNGCQKKDRV